MGVLCPGLNRFCPCSRLPPTEQIFQNLRQEYSRIQRRRQLEGAFNQTEACSSSDAPSPSSSLNAPSSPPGRRLYCWPYAHLQLLFMVFTPKSMSMSFCEASQKTPWLDLHDQLKSQEAGSSEQSRGHRDCDSRCEFVRDL